MDANLIMNIGKTGEKSRFDYLLYLLGARGTRKS